MFKLFFVIFFQYLASAKKSETIASAQSSFKIRFLNFFNKNKKKILIFFVVAVVVVAIGFAFKKFCFQTTNDKRIKITKEEFEKKVDQVVEEMKKNNCVKMQVFKDLMKYISYYDSIKNNLIITGFVSEINDENCKLLKNFFKYLFDNQETKIEFPTSKDKSVYVYVVVSKDSVNALSSSPTTSDKLKEVFRCGFKNASCYETAILFFINLTEADA